MRHLLTNSIAFAAEGTGGASGGQEGATEQPAATGATAGSETILSGKVDDAASAETDAGKKAAAASADAEGGWKEYVPDDSKTAAENDALKAEHDKAKPAEGDDKSSAADKADVVPEDGKYDITLEGDMELDTALLEKAAPVMKELGLTNGQASKLAGVIAEQRKAEYDGQNERLQKIVSDWQKEIKTDKDFGGDNLTTSVNKADRVLATFGDDALRRDLVELGIGNHPGLFRLLARVGNALSDDKPVTSETPAASKRSPEEAMYGATTPTTRG
jgi:hypothetical protein